MKRIVTRLLLWILNSRWLNSSPCEYGFIGNVDAFSYANLASEEKMQPGITVREILDSADRFRSCPMKPNGMVVIEQGICRDATEQDYRDLAFALQPKNGEKNA